MSRVPLASLRPSAHVWFVFLSRNRVRPRLLLRTSQTRHWHIQACSGVTGDGLVEGIDWLVGDIGQRIFMME